MLAKFAPNCRFSLHIQEKDEVDLRPVFTEDGITYIYIKVSHLPLVLRQLVALTCLHCCFAVQQPVVDGGDEEKLQRHTHSVLLVQTDDGKALYVHNCMFVSITLPTRAHLTLIALV